MIDIRDMQFQYPGTKTTITVPELVVARGEVVCILGPSGQGKSTLLHLIAGLIEADTGTIDRGLTLQDKMCIRDSAKPYDTC